MNAVQRYAAINPLESLSKEKRSSYCTLGGSLALELKILGVLDVSAALSSIYEEVLVVATDGTLTADIRPACAFIHFGFVEEDGKRERGSYVSGGRFGLDWSLK